MVRDIKVPVRMTSEEKKEALEIMKENGFENLSQFIRFIIKKQKKSQS